MAGTEEVEARVEEGGEERVEAKVDAGAKVEVEAKVEARVEADVEADVEVEVEAEVEAEVGTEVEAEISGIGQGQCLRDTIFDSPRNLMVHPSVSGSGNRNWISFYKQISLYNKVYFL